MLVVYACGLRQGAKVRVVGHTDVVRVPGAILYGAVWSWTRGGVFDRDSTGLESF